MSTGDTWRLGHRPALDGLRGVAILLVVVSHMGTGRTQGLGAGVTVFFTLSGFLITNLLLEELARDRTIDLRRFYVRRARRLAPALVVLLVFVAALAALLGPRYSSQITIWSSLLYVSNWVMTSGTHGHDALGHTWSLSIEEQFYLLWPLLLLGASRLGRRAVVVTLLALTAASSVARLVMFADGGTWGEIYYPLHLRADSLLIGCLLALAMHGRPAGTPARFPGVATATAVAFIVAWSFVNPYLILVFGPVVVGLATAAAIYWAVQDEHRACWLERPILRLIGQRSYALYLYHWPLVILVRLFFPSAGWWAMAAVVVPTAWGLALLSWRFVESPFLRRGGRATGARHSHYVRNPAAMAVRQAPR